MASKNRSDWLAARDDFIAPLDRRLPGPPYPETMRAWGCRIMRQEAEDRARVLSTPLGLKLTEPKDENEQTFVRFNTVASASAEHGNELTAIEQWETIASQLQPDDPAQRPWYLLARKRADDLRASIVQREE